MAKKTRTDIWIDAPIGADMWGDGITAKSVREQIEAIGSADIRLRINSPGGDAHEAMSIRSILQEHPGEVSGHVDGLAASAATFLLPTHAPLTMAEASLFMIHEPYTLAIGDADMMRKEAEKLDKHAETIAAIYAARTNRTTYTDVEDMRSMMRAETWFTSREAVDQGFADGITGEAVAACVIPSTLAARYHIPQAYHDQRRSRCRKAHYLQQYKQCLALTRAAAAA